MRTQDTVSGWFVPKRVGLALVLLGSIVIVCGCGDWSVTAVLDPDSGHEGGDDSTDGNDDPSHVDDVPGLIDDDVTDPPDEPPSDPGNTDDSPSNVGGGDPSGGQHLGERRQLEVEITFSQEFGETVTDSSGTHYYFNGIVINEDKVYPEEYWGTYPLYFFGTTVGVTVRITNPGPRRKVKVRVRTEAYVLLTDGSNGAQLAPLQEVDLEVARGQTVTLDTSFTPEYDPNADDMEGGLDRFIVSVLHPNTGGTDAALIMTKEGVFCPPELEGDL